MSIPGLGRPNGAPPPAAPHRTTVLLLLLGLGAALSVYSAIRRHFDAAHVHGLPPAVRPIHVVAMSPAFYAKEVQPRVQDDACTEALAEATGLSSRNGLQRLLAPYLADALYLPGSDSIFILGTPQMLPHGVLSHEMAHAIQDQYVDLRRLTTAPSIDEDMATRATLEGVATVAVDSTLPSAPLVDFSDDVIANWNQLVYSYGPRRVWADRRSWVEQSRHPASTTQAVMFGIPQAMLAPVAIPPRPVPLAGDVPGCTSRLGALAVSTAFRRFSGVTALARGSALAWRGDEAAIVVRGRSRRFFWRVVFAPGADRLGQIWRTWYPDSGRVLGQD
jgi:hypothetical protein